MAMFVVKCMVIQINYQAYGSNNYQRDHFVQGLAVRGSREALVHRGDVVEQGPWLVALLL